MVIQLQYQFKIIIIIIIIIIISQVSCSLILSKKKNSHVPWAPWRNTKTKANVL